MRIGKKHTQSIGSLVRGFNIGKRRALKTVLVLAALTLVVLFDSKVHDGLKHRLLCSHVMHIGGSRQSRLLSEEDCATIWPQPDSEAKKESWSVSYPPLIHAKPEPGGPVSPEPKEEVGYVVIYADCPGKDPVTDTTSTGGDDVTSTVPGQVTDTAAVMKHTISCANGKASVNAAGSPVDSTTTTATTTTTTSLTASDAVSSADADAMDPNLPAPELSTVVYAIVHPDAMHCPGPDGVEYDRVTLLQKMGFFVKIWDTPVSEDSLTQPYLKENIGDDVGLKDLMKLAALQMVDHKYVVVLDENYMLNKPLDALMAEMDRTGAPFAYIKDPITNLIDTDILVMKPDKETSEEIFEKFRTVPYTEDGGWGDSGIGAQPGGMGTSGILEYFINDNTAENPHTGIELDRCLYANNADDTCNQIPMEDIVGYEMTDDICGQPWKCDIVEKLDSFSDETKALCAAFFHKWIETRDQFDETFTPVTTAADGAYHEEVYEGICNGVGPSAYIPLLPDELPAPENCKDGSLRYHGCDLDMFIATNTDLGTGLSLDVNLNFPRQCEVHYAEPNNGGAKVAFSGYAEISGVALPDTSMVFVIDRSGSTCDEQSLGCASDENYDLQFDDTLDCEIAAVLDMVTKVRVEGTVGQIGLVSFSHKLGTKFDTATIELPLTDIRIPDGQTFHAIEDAIRAIDCGGATNYAAAVEKACEVIDDSITTHNVVIFISDGLPTRGGSPSNYCQNGAVFHTIALGKLASCELGVDISLQKIADSTKGTCQQTDEIASIRVLLKEIADVQFLSVQGSTVASETSVNWGCTDVKGFSSNFGGADFGCVDLYNMNMCGFPFPNTLGQTIANSCCKCGGGVYLEVGDLEQGKGDPVVPRADSLAVTTFQDVATMMPGQHTVCTTVIGAGAGVPSANVQCRNVLICANPADYA